MFEWSELLGLFSHKVDNKVYGSMASLELCCSVSTINLSLAPVHTSGLSDDKKCSVGPYMLPKKKGR